MVTAGSALADAYTISRGVVSSSGSVSNSAGYSISGTAGQAATGLSQSQSYSVAGGFNPTPGILPSVPPTTITTTITPAPPPASSSPSSTQLPERFITSPANMVVTNLNVQPQQAQAIQPVTIYANIANRGDESGSYTATLKINGQIEETRTGRVGGRAAVPLQFVASKDKPGIYTVDINGQQASFAIIEASRDNPFRDVPLISFFAFAFLIMVVLGMILVRRYSAE